MSASLLSIKNLNVAIDRIPVLRDVSMAAPKGSMVGLIGRNVPAKR